MFAPNPNYTPGAVSPDVFLSQNGIRYDNGLLTGTPAEIVANLKALNALRILKDGQLQETVYRTPGYVPGDMGPQDFDPALLKATSDAMTAYRQVLKTGDLSAVHAAVDAVNNWRAQGGYAAMVPPSDFEIVKNASTPLGVMARVIASERIAVQESVARGDNPVQGSIFGSPLPWFDTMAAYKALGGK